MWGVAFLVVCLGLIEVEGAATLRPSQVVQVSGGKIQGKTFTFENGKEATAFLGIPYGKAPVGPLRFKKPLPALPWSGVKNTSEFASRCYFYDTSIPIQPSEDCLFLNVFVPGSKIGVKNPNKKLYPIAFDIHGGAFQYGDPYYSGDEPICRYLNTKDVIVVNINFRQQFFGFLALDQNTPGNIGLWDMKLALEWVKKNALAFGGNPNLITVMGDSTGAIATDQLTISPHTRNLFQQAIMYSGNNFMGYAINSIETLREYAKKFAVGVGFEVDETWSYEQENAALLEFFQNSPPETITIGYLPSNETSGSILTAPSLDGDFFPKDLKTLRKEAPRKRVLAGDMHYEALLFLVGRPTDIYPTIYDYAKFYLTSYYAPYPARINDSTADVMLQTFVNMSLPVDSLEFYKQCVVAVSDFLFNYPTWKMFNTRTKQKHEITYLYNFTYFDPASLPPFEPFVAATHTLESCYITGRSMIMPSFVPNQADLAKLELFTTALTNFIKGKQPLNNWLPYSPITNKYHWFGQNTNQDGMISQFGDKRFAKWDELYQRFGIKLER